MMNTSPRNEGTALVLAALPGILGLVGIGHIYLGRVERGVVLLVVGLLLAVPGTALAFTAPALGLPLLLILFVPLWVWSIFDTRNICRGYNDALDSTGQPP